MMVQIDAQGWETVAYNAGVTYLSDNEDIDQALPTLGVWTLVPDDPLASNPFLIATVLPYLPTWWEKKGYETYSKLCGCRNGYGHDPISKPRGLPSDYVPLVLKDGSKVDAGCFGFSWVTAREVLTHDWGRRGREFVWFAMAWARVSRADKVRFVFGFD